MGNKRQIRATNGQRIAVAIFLIMLILIGDLITGAVSSRAPVVDSDTVFKIQYATMKFDDTWAGGVAASGNFYCSGVASGNLTLAKRSTMLWTGQYGGIANNVSSLLVGAGLFYSSSPYKTANDGKPVDGTIIKSCNLANSAATETLFQEPILFLPSATTATDTAYSVNVTLAPGTWYFYVELVVATTVLWTSCGSQATTCDSVIVEVLGTNP